MKRIAFAAPPFAGHLNPLVALAQAAQRAGYDVEVLTGEAKLPAVRALGLRAREPAGVGAGELEAVADGDGRVGSNPLRLAGQLERSLAAAARVRGALLEDWGRVKPDLVVADFMAPPAGLAAQALGVPWITTHPTPFAVEGRRGPPSYLGGLKPSRGLGGRVRDALGWTAVRWGKDAMALAFSAPLSAAGLPRRRVGGREAVYSSTRILAFGLPELEFDRDWPDSVRLIGPVVTHPEAAPELDLPPGRNVLITFGTHLPWAKAGLEASALALAERVPEASFTVSLGRPEAAGAPVRRLSERVRVSSFVSYSRDLPRFDVVVHHGGAGAVWACASAGVPQIVAPQDYDQPDWAARVEHFGLGVRVKRIDTAAAAAALRDVLARTPPGVARLKAAVARSDPAGAFLQAVAEAIGAP